MLMLSSLHHVKYSALYIRIARSTASLLFLLLLFAHPSWAALSVVQSAQNFAASGTTSITVPISTTAGNLLVVFCMNGGNNTATATISDNAGQSWTQTTSGYASSASSNRS